jgi:EAL domain-containing protein (putative c-di-GMP-specific phosphodiesterase class I)/DNA-binding response OmpR family regulator
MARARKQAVVLVLDDEESVGALVNAALPEKGFRIIWRPDVESAFATIERNPPDIALIDIDLHGPQKGFELLRRLRSNQETATVPVVMVTGSADTLNREKSLRMGADRYLIKPVRAETLRRVVRELLAVRDELWWTVTMREEQSNRLRELLFDTTTDVPTLALVVDDVRRMIESGQTLHVICLEIEPLFRTGERDLWEPFDRLRREFVRGLRVMASPILGNDVIIATSHSGANDFYCFARAVNPSTNVGVLARDLERTARNALKSLHADPLEAEEVMIVAGGSVSQPQPGFAPRMLYNAVREAKDSAERRETRYLQAMREKLIRAINDRAISTLFQPVIDLRNGAVLGFEALSRGPKGTDIENPEVLFELARDFDLVWELESLCIENIQPWLNEVCQRGFLFFNVESHFIQQLHYRGTGMFESFFSCHRQVVIEVTERSAIRDYGMFRRALHELKSMGFKIAIDDCGSGYATLEAIAELKPDYLKVGHSLFNGVEHDPIRRRLVDLVARCAESIGAGTIAEAIETEEQLRVTRELGIDKGQGYLFAPPGRWEDVKNLRPRF